MEGQGSINNNDYALNLGIGSTKMYYMNISVKNKFPLMNSMWYTTRTQTTVTNAQHCILLANQHFYKLRLKSLLKVPRNIQHFPPSNLVGTIIH